MVNWAIDASCCFCMAARIVSMSEVDFLVAAAISGGGDGGGLAALEAPTYVWRILMVSSRASTYAMHTSSLAVAL